MLYDPKWEVQTETKTRHPLKLATLVAWLEKQPADEIYRYEDSGECLLGRYFAACGWTNVGLGHIFVASDQQPNAVQMPKSFQRTAATEPHTFGAALKRTCAYRR